MSRFCRFYAQLKWQILLQVIERPYITMGMASLLILSVLALTSTELANAPWQRLETPASMGLSRRTAGAAALGVAA